MTFDLNRSLRAIRSAAPAPGVVRALDRELGQSQLGQPQISPPARSGFNLESSRAAIRSAGMGLGYQATPSTEGPSILERVPKPVMGALRHISSALEPLQLAQDAFFATIAGAIDPKTTIAQRLGNMDWGAYVPGREAPSRPASGEEIFRLMGVGERGAKWAGIGADLIVDPLIFGSWLRIGGKALKSATMVELGNRVDSFVSPIGLTAKANNLARRSATFSAFQDRRMAELISAVRNPESTVFGIRNFGKKTTAMAKFALPRDRFLQMRFGAEAGTELFRAEQRGLLMGKRISDEALMMLQNAVEGVAGDRSKMIIQSYVQAMEGQAAARRALLSDLDPGIRDVIEAQVYKLANEQVGVGFLAVAARNVDDIADPSMRGLATELRSALDGFDLDIKNFGQEFLDRKWASTTPRLQEARELVGSTTRQRAQTLKASPAKMEEMERSAIRVFDDYLRETVLIDARLGLHTSGYPFVSNMVRERVLELTGDALLADSIWNSVLAAGLRGGQEGIDLLKESRTAIRLPKYAGGHAQMEHRLKKKQVFYDAVQSERDRLAGIKEMNQQVRLGERMAKDVKVGLREAEDAIAREAFERSQRGRLGAQVRTRNLRRKAILEGAEELPEQTMAYAVGARSLLNSLGALKTKASQETFSKLESHISRWAGTIEEVVGAADISTGAIGRLMQAETGMIAALKKQADMMQRAIDSLPTPRRLRFGEAPESPLKFPDTTLATAPRRQPSKSPLKFAKGMQSRTIAGRLEEMRDQARHLASTLEQITANKAKLRETVVADMQRAREAASAAVASNRATRQAVQESRKAEDAAERAARAAEREAAREARQAEALERAAEGLPRQGSTRDLTRLGDEAVDASGIGPTPPPRPMPAIPEHGINSTLDDIAAARMRNALSQANRSIRGTTPGQLDIDEIMSAPVTFGELLDGIADMQALRLGDYLEGLMNGHLRRAYGLFADEGSFERFIDSLRVGNLVWQRTLDETRLPEQMVGFEREARLILEYQSALKSAGSGSILSRNRIIEYLNASGVSDARIKGAMDSLVRATGAGNPQWEEFMRLLDVYVPQYKALQAQAQRSGGVLGDQPTMAYERFFKEREILPQNVLEAFGEYAMGSMSVVEGAQYARRVVSRQEYFQEVFRMAQQRGLLKTEQFIDEFGASYRKLGESDAILSGFGGKYIHPYLYDELVRASQVPNSFIPAAFSRARSLITGGYLAAPTVIAANFIGGFYQTAMIGINPVTMMKRLAEVLPDMRALGRGYRTPLVEEMRRTTTIEATNLIANEGVDQFVKLSQRRLGLDTTDGVARLADEFATWYERVLQAPLGIKAIGLHAFQFTENWFKLATYKHMRQTLESNWLRANPGREALGAATANFERQAAEFARIAVFDYSSLPTSLEFLKRSGLLLFPGFPYFIAGRTIGTALTRPGRVAVADRVTEAVANISMPIEDQVALHLGSAGWMSDEQMVPYRVRQNENGDRIASVIPMAQLIPTSSMFDGLPESLLAGNPLAESIGSLGLFGPIWDIFSALTTGSGEAPLSGRFGGRVFEPGATAAETASQVMRFMYNNWAPSVVRRGVSMDTAGNWTGLIPSTLQGLQELGGNMPDDLLHGIYSIEERRTRRPQRDWFDTVMSSFIRSPQVVALDGPLAGIRNEMTRARAQLNREIEPLQNRLNRARANGEMAEAEELAARIRAKQAEFNQTWAEFTAFYRHYQAQQNQQNQQASR